MFLTRKQLIFRFIHRAMLAIAATTATLGLYTFLFMIFLASN